MISKIKILTICMLLNFIYADEYTGYLKIVEASICMDDCSYYELVDEENSHINYIMFSDYDDVELYINRYVNIEGNEISCLVCNTIEVEQIYLNNDCEYPVDCFQDPCIDTECPSNDFTNCIPSFCGGCYADFYDFNEVLVDCHSDVEIEPCYDVDGLDFGMCDMYLGVAVLNGVCNHMSGCGWDIDEVDYSDAFFQTIDDCYDACYNEPYLCEDIQYDYEQLFSDVMLDCIYNNDCISVWGDCSVGLGGCHYSVNESLYDIDEVEELVDLWNLNECMEWVCDCASLPPSVCNDGLCELAYCYDTNPEGCFNSGCDEGYQCVVTEECVPSSCFCDSFYGYWSCTEDCGGGSCVPLSILGDVNYDGNVDVVDIVMIVNMILGISDVDLNADYNQDGLVNVIDIIEIINLILNS